MKQSITRLKVKNGFQYKQSDKLVDDQDELARIAALAIPPAWQRVRIASGKRSKIQAEGYDKAGRKQYIYHPAFRARQEAAKFKRITSFADKLPALRAQIKKDLNRKQFDKQKVIAAAVSLMDETYFRVGNESHTKETGHYGLTTLRSKHITIKGDSVIFDFIGKSGQQQHKAVTNKMITRTIKHLDDMPGRELFRYYDDAGAIHDLSSSDVNAYIKENMGDEYSAKDFRTWAGTLLATMELARLTRPATQRERKKSMTACVKRVAQKLGNTPAIARSSYIDPRIFTLFESSNGLGDMFATIKNMKQSEHLNSDEQYVLKLLS